MASEVVSGEVVVVAVVVAAVASVGALGAFAAGGDDGRAQGRELRSDL